MTVLILILAIAAIVLAILAAFGVPQTTRLLCGSVLCLAAIEILQHL